METPTPAYPNAFLIAEKRTHWRTGRQEWILVGNEVFKYREDAETTIAGWLEDDDPADPTEYVILQAAPAPDQVAA